MTGEMHYTSILKGGEHYGWAQLIRTAAQSIARRTKFALRFEEMRPFDVYQGPYAVMNHGELWSAEAQGTFFYRGLGIEVCGTVEHIAAKVREVTDKRVQR